jgi:hypothetical protein
MSENQQEELAKLGHHSKKYTKTEADVVSELCIAFDKSHLSLAQKLGAFPRHVRRQDIARFLTKYEIFKSILPVNGSIIECGVFTGGGIMAWCHFSAILEPYNHTRRIIGFDTFSGFPDVNEKDNKGISEHLHHGAFKTNDSMLDELQHWMNCSN